MRISTGARSGQNAQVEEKWRDGEKDNAETQRALRSAEKVKKPERGEEHGKVIVEHTSINPNKAGAHRAREECGAGRYDGANPEAHGEQCADSELH